MRDYPNLCGRGAQEADPHEDGAQPCVTTSSKWLEKALGVVVTKCAGLEMGVGIEVALQQDGGGGTVNLVALFARADAGLGEQAGGFDGGEAFVPVFERHGQLGGEIGSELLHAVGLQAVRTVEVQGEAGDDAGGGVFGDQRGDGGGIGVAPARGQGGQGTGHEAEFIADRYADAFAT